MGSKFSKKKQGYDFDQASKSTGKKNPRSGKLNRRWKSVDVYTQTGDDEAKVLETSRQVKATISMDDLRDSVVDNATYQHANGRNKTHISSSDESSDVNEDKKKKKKKKKLKKSKDKKNKNNDNEKKRLKKKRKDNMEAAVVINVSDVSDVEENMRHSAIMVNNPVYQSADLPEPHKVKTSSSSSSDNEKEPQQPSGDDLANEILEVVSSVQLIQDIEETLEIESLPEPPPVPQRTEENFQEEYETLEKVQSRAKRSSSSSSDEEEHHKIEGQITITTNDIDFNDDEDIVYENAILRSHKEEPIAIPYAEEAPNAAPEIPENIQEPNCEVVKVFTMPNPEFTEVRKISRSRSSSSSSSSEDEEINVVEVPEPLDPFKVEEEPPKGPIFEDVLITTVIPEDTEFYDIPRETEAPIIQVAVIDDEEPPAVPEKPPRLRRTISSSSSSSSSVDEGELIISEEVLPPPPVDDDPPTVTDEVVEMAETIAEAIVMDTIENIKVEAVLLPREVPEPSSEVDPEVQIKQREPNVIQAEPKVKQRRGPKSSTSSSSSDSSDSD